MDEPEETLRKKPEIKLHGTRVWNKANDCCHCVALFTNLDNPRERKPS